MAEDIGDRASPKRRSRLAECLSCCFGGGGRGGAGGEGFESQESQTAAFVRSSSVWIRSKAQEIPEIKDKCRGLISRLGKPRRHPADFRYDPLSYALNFDEGADFDTSGEVSPVEFRYRNFSSRLPPSPPHLNTAGTTAGKEIACN